MCSQWFGVTWERSDKQIDFSSFDAFDPHLRSPSRLALIPMALTNLASKVYVCQNNAISSRRIQRKAMECVIHQCLLGRGERKHCPEFIGPGLLRRARPTSRANDTRGVFLLERAKRLCLPSSCRAFWDTCILPSFELALNSPPVHSSSYCFVVWLLRCVIH